MIAACEAEYAQGDGPAIEAGEVLDPTEWRAHYRFAHEHGEVAVPLEDLPPDAVDEWERRAERFEDEGHGTVVIVWRLEDGSHAQCAVAVDSGAVVTGSAVTGRLQIEEVQAPQ